MATDPRMPASPPVGSRLRAYTLRTLTGHGNRVQHVAWGRLGDQLVLATAASDGTARIWDAASGNPVATLTGHRGVVVHVAWGRLGDHLVLATAGSDGTARIWDAASGNQLAMLFGHWGVVIHIAWGRLGDRVVLATAGYDGTARIWDAASGNQLAMLTGHENRVHHVAWGRLGDQVVLATAGYDGTARIWDPASGSPLAMLTGHTGAVQRVAWAQLGDQVLVATAGADGTARIWNVVTEQFSARLPLYRSDDPSDLDRLSRDSEAVALAEVITSRSALPPLAIGLFGDWGEGKSHFLGRVQTHVALIADQARPDDPLTHSAVRQVRFNAWHYAESDLWASLVAEVFAQAATDQADPGGAQRRQSRLASELIERRHLRERLEAARQRQDRLQGELAKSDLSAAWQALPVELRNKLQAAGGTRAEDLYRDVADSWSGAKKTITEIKVRARLALRLIKAVGSTRQMLLAVALAAAGAAAWIFGPRLLHSHQVQQLASIPAVAAAVAFVGAVHRGWEATKQGWEKTKSALRDMSQALHKHAERQRWHLETARDVAAAEVAGLEAQIQNLSTAGQLAGMVSERARDGMYRSRLGLMTQIREDFERMAELLVPSPGQAPALEDAAGDELPRIERIVVYIDDLDRCPPARVIEVLEAVHLLLALRLFVVVVAVDPRWLLRAVAVHYRELLETDDESVRPRANLGLSLSPVGSVGSRVSVHPDIDSDGGEDASATPAQYLEKIFQIPLTLPPLTSGGYASMIGWLVGPGPDPPQAPLEATTAPADGSASGGASVKADQPTEDGFEDQASEVRLPRPRTVERLDPMALTADERRFMDLLGPPFITTPRAVKRFTNSYGFLNALRGERRRRDTGAVTDQATGTVHFPHRAALTLLAALIGFPALSPTLFVQIHYAAVKLPEQSWCQFLDDITPKGMEDGSWESELLGPLEAVAAHRWLRLTNSLRALEHKAAKAQLDLPVGLRAWAEWVVDVGRLSFQTGHAVTHLHTNTASLYQSEHGSGQGANED